MFRGIPAKSEGSPPEIWPACEVDRVFRLRKGTASAAYKSGALVGVRRKGRGGYHVYVLKEDAMAWWWSLNDPN
jgi:hypothetical protein